jgi:hypothetical protein
MQHDTPRLAYTVEQALGSGAFSSRNKLYAAIASGDLRSFLDGKRRMISADALREYIAKRERAMADGKASGAIPKPMSDAKREQLAALNKTRKHAAA